MDLDCDGPNCWLKLGPSLFCVSGKTFVLQFMFCQSSQSHHRNALTPVYPIKQINIHKLTFFPSRVCEQ